MIQDRRKYKKLTGLLICLFAGTACFGQNNYKVYLQGYNYLNPGIEVGYDHGIFQSNNERFSIKLGLSLETYNQKDNHTGIAVNTNLSINYHTKNGFSMGIYGDAGLLRTILKGLVYELDAQNEFKNSRFAGNFHPQWKTGVILSKTLPNNTKAIAIKAGIRQPNFPASPIIPNLGFGLHF